MFCSWPLRILLKKRRIISAFSTLVNMRVNQCPYVPECALFVSMWWTGDLSSSSAWIDPLRGKVIILVDNGWKAELRLRLPVWLLFHQLLPAQCQRFSLLCRRGWEMDVADIIDFDSGRWLLVYAKAKSTTMQVFYVFELFIPLS